MATGQYTTASGLNSISGGQSSIASGSTSFAFGYTSQARTDNEIVFGRYNLLPAVSASSPTTWVNTDNLFVVGNGSSSTSRSNALTVRKDAATSIGVGVVASQAGQVVVGNHNDLRPNDNGTNHTQGVFVVGAGTATVKRNALRVLADGTVLINAAGDLPMDGFTAGEKP
jgi:hypothetical protein